MKSDEKQAIDTKPLSDQISENVTFITRDRKLIYPELKINKIYVSEVKAKSTTNKPPPKKVFPENDLQLWCFDKVKSKLPYFQILFFFLKGGLYL